MRVDGMVADHVARHGGQQSGFTSSSLLVVVLEPVPATRSIGLLRLRGIKHVEAALACRFVHAGAGRKVVRILGAAVQHDYQRKRPAATVTANFTRWDIQLVVACAVRVGEAAGDVRARTRLRLRACGRERGCRPHLLSGVVRGNFARLDVDDIDIDIAAHRRPGRFSGPGRRGRAAQCGLDRGGGAVKVAGTRQSRGLGHQALEGGIHECPWNGSSLGSALGSALGSTHAVGERRLDRRAGMQRAQHRQ